VDSNYKPEKCANCRFLHRACGSTHEKQAPAPAPVKPVVVAQTPSIVHPAPAPRPARTEPETLEERRKRRGFEALIRRFSADGPHTTDEQEAAIRAREEAEDAAAIAATAPAVVEKVVETPVLVPAKRKPGRRPGGVKTLALELLMDIAWRIQNNEIEEIPKRLRRVQRYFGPQKPRKKYRLKAKLYVHRKVNANKVLVVPSKMRRPRKRAEPAQITTAGES